MITFICNHCGWIGNMLTAKYYTVKELQNKGYIDEHCFSKIYFIKLNEIPTSNFAFCPHCNAHIKIVTNLNLTHK